MSIEMKDAVALCWFKQLGERGRAISKQPAQDRIQQHLHVLASLCLCTRCNA